MTTNGQIAVMKVVADAIMTDTAAAAGEVEATNTAVTTGAQPAAIETVTVTAIVTRTRGVTVIETVEAVGMIAMRGAVGMIAMREAVVMKEAVVMTEAVAMTEAVVTGIEATGVASVTATRAAGRIASPRPGADPRVNMGNTLTHTHTDCIVVASIRLDAERERANECGIPAGHDG